MHTLSVITLAAALTAAASGCALKPQTSASTSLVLKLYYLSEVGATQELRYEHVPGAWEPSIKITPETRVWATPI